ncbi:hypothetical protein SAFG77S_02038 [Streptomyces afghaniensis]
MRRSNFRDDWVKDRKTAGITVELHFHDLRHTGNTLASTAGASTRELMTRVGHSSSRAALIYQHMASDRDRTIADRLGAMIRAGGEGPPAQGCGTHVALEVISFGEVRPVQAWTHAQAGTRFGPASVRRPRR